MELPNTPIRTAGSLEGIWGRKGRISSKTNHLSRCSRSFPMHTKQLTRTFNLKCRFSIKHSKSEILNRKK